MNSPDVFKAITVWQPWAWLLALGIKPIENRPRYSHHRGSLLIHAGQKWDKQGALWILDKFPDLKDRVSQARNLCGGIVGKVNMIDCVKEHPSPWFVGKWGGCVCRALNHGSHPLPWPAGVVQYPCVRFNRGNYRKTAKP